jgi:2-hydroxy-6-oxonona-2,4-dienedioate hydrolase
VTALPRGFRASSREVGEHRVHAFHGGLAAAPPILLVHGLGVSGRYFLPLAERLARHFAVHIPELPGHGDSSRPDHALDVPALADVLEAWLEAAGLPDQLVIVANSMGCQVAAALCVLRPVRARALVFIGPTLDPANRQMLRLAARFVGTGFFERLSLPWRLLVDYTRMGWRRYAEELRHMRADRIERRLPYVSAPTLVLRGSQDLVVPAAWASHVTGLLPDGRLVTVPGWGHALHYSVPDEAAALVRAFVTSLASSSAPTHTPPAFGR